MSLLGTKIGRIRLVDSLGKGGMGEVFVGYDETLDRKVAVKCVRVGGPTDDTRKRRFLQEARILSRLDHPNICQIYDFVEGEGRDFLVMELVEGRSLEQAADAGLDAKAKLEIAQHVADVLVAAHAEGVVHRDLKPEHVMITGDGVVKVLDFGIAHSVGVDDADIDRTVDFSSAEARALAVARTMAGSVVGTPRYMSPEQARGEPVTPASDMYTFGLLLQELFTGTRPHSRRTLADQLLEVGEGKSRPVVGLGPALTALIEDLKSLKPGDRPTAKETADRLRLIRETPSRRLRRAAAAAAVVLVVAGAAKYTVDLRRERTAAVAARDQAEDLVAFMLEDLSGELRPVGKLDVLEQVARKALDYYERAAPETTGAPAFRRGQAYQTVAEVLDSQGDLDAALEAATAARDIRQRLVDEDPDRAEWRNGLALDQLEVGDILRQHDDRTRALASIEAGRQIAASLVESDPGNVEWRRTLAEANYGLGMFHVFSQPETADAAFRRAIAIYRQLVDDDPGDLHYKYRLAVLHGQGLGQTYRQRGMAEESFAAVREAYSLYEEVTRADPSNSKWQHGFAWENRRMGQHLELEGKLPEALAYFERAKGITERLLSLEPSQVDWQLGLAADYSAIGGIRETQGDLAGALDSYAPALEISRRLVESDPSRVRFRHWLASDHLMVAAVLAELGRTGEAEDSWQRAAELTAPDAGKTGDAVGEALETHALALLHLGRVDDARPVVDRLRRLAWFEGSADDELVELCRRHGVLLPAPL